MSCHFHTIDVDAATVNRAKARGQSGEWPKKWQ